ncbi:MAG: xylose isomerase [Firmicutes bacterium]|nr:xylose isomerase [Bacillota bacterium]
MEAARKPQPSDRFTFGLWTVGNRGRDPFGDAVRPPLASTTVVERLSELGAYGVSLHDNDLVPIDATAGERDRIVREFQKALQDWNLRVPMVTVNLFYDPVFKDGALTSSVRSVRQYAVEKTKRAMDLGAELGAEIFVLWGGREGSEMDGARDARQGLAYYRESLNTLCEYVKTQRYAMRIALEPKPNEPRSDIYLPSVGSMLAFIQTLDDPEMVGVNPEVAHAKMAGLNPVHEVAQALDAGKLFHIDLNDQRIGRFDQDLRFGSDDLKGAFYLVKLLEDSHYLGPLHFDAHAYRTEDAEGVWDFAAGCMRTYLILKDKVRQFYEDTEIQSALAEWRAWCEQERPIHSREDREFWGQAGYRYERLDQLINELILGVR